MGKQSSVEVFFCQAENPPKELLPKELLPKELLPKELLPKELLHTNGNYPIGNG